MNETQDLVRGDGTLAGFQQRTAVVDAGVLGPGTYEYKIPVPSRGTAVLTSKPTTLAGACTLQVSQTLADGDTVDPNVAVYAVPLALNASREDLIELSPGVLFLRITVVVPAGGQLAFGQLEYRTSRLAATSRGRIALVTASFNRPNDANGYAANDLVANSTVAGNVAPVLIPIAAIVGGGTMLRRLRAKFGAVGWLNAIVRVHLFSALPVPTVGDNGAFSVVSGAGFILACTESTYLGAIDVTLDHQFSDNVVKGIAAPAVGSEINLVPIAGTTSVAALVETLSAVAAPGNSTLITITAEALN